MQRLIHLIEEYKFRKQKLPAAESISISRNNFSPHRLLWRAPGETLVKVGKREHMQALMEEGQVMISSATSYFDPSFNTAVRDDELELQQFVPGMQIYIAVLDGKPVAKARPITDMMATAWLQDDYYLYSMTHTMSDRLFDDFEKDSCVVINNPEVFLSRLRNAVSKTLPGSRWCMQSKQVRYIDPYVSSSLPKNYDVFFTKDFRYCYQQEHRFAWIPKSGKGGQKKLAKFLVTLEPLNDIAQMYSL